MLSFVIPCYRSERTIEKVVDEIIATVLEREGYDYEIVCVNDCSPDNVYQVLQKLAAENKRIKVLNLAKNMGKHAAVMAGYSFVSGEYIINLDDDFQCPTYELWRLLEPLERDEFDCTTANYYKKRQVLWKNIGSAVNAYMASIMLECPRSLRFENLFVIKKFVMNEMMKYTNPYPYLQGLILRVTSRVGVVKMEERERWDHQATGYTLGKSMALFANGFTAFSVKPLRASTIIGVLASIIGFIAGLAMVIRKLVNPDILMGYTSLIVLQLFIGGLILMCLGLLGEYVGRIYICLNKSPQYVIKETLNVDR